MKSRPLAYMAGVISILVWGLSFIGMKWLMHDFPPMTMMCVRYIIAAAIMLPTLLIARPGISQKPALSKPVFFSGLLLGIFSALEAQGVNYTTSSVASLIFACIPMMLLFAELIINKNRPSPYDIAGVALSCAGVCLLIIFSTPGTADAPNPPLGNMLIIAACVAWVAYTLISKKALASQSALFVTSWHMLWSAAALIPFAISEWPQWKPVPLLSWGLLVAMVLFCNIAGYFAYSFALHRLGSVKLNTFINFQPVVTVLAGFFILGETLSYVQIIGGIVVILGILAITLPLGRFFARFGRRRPISGSDLTPYK